MHSSIQQTVIENLIVDQSYGHLWARVGHRGYNEWDNPTMFYVLHNFPNAPPDIQMLEKPFLQLPEPTH